MAATQNTHRVEWGETDAAAIVFYANYFRWFDRGTHDLFRGLDLPIERLMAQGIVIPIIEAQARFLHPVVYADELVIQSRVAEVRSRAFRVEHKVLRGDEVVGEGYEVRMWVRRSDAGGRLEPELIPAAVARRIAP
jgi:acyl-CoA thioester hydrolase